MKLLDIGKVVKASGVKASALRYYEQKGLIRSISRHGLRRQYEPQVLQTLTLINLGRLAGLSLDEIATMFTNKRDLAIDRDMLQNKVDELDHTIKKLSLVKDTMQHVVTCPSEDHLACPSFQQLLKVVERFTQKDK